MHIKPQLTFFKPQGRKPSLPPNRTFKSAKTSSSPKTSFHSGYNNQDRIADLKFRLADLVDSIHGNQETLKKRAKQVGNPAKDSIYQSLKANLDKLEAQARELREDIVSLGGDVDFKPEPPDNYGGYEFGPEDYDDL